MFKLDDRKIFTRSTTLRALAHELYTVADLLLAIFLLTLSYISVRPLKRLDGTLLPHVSVLWGQSSNSSSPGYKAQNRFLTCSDVSSRYNVSRF